MAMNPRSVSHGQDTPITSGQSQSPQEQPGPLRSSYLDKVPTQRMSSSTDIHHGGHKQYLDMLRQRRSIRNPDQLCFVPVTHNQQYGWMVSESPEPWTLTKRFPRKKTEMTRFVEEMTLTDREFSLF